MKILVACDGSEYALRAFQRALDLAGNLKVASEITLISVHDDLALRHAQRFVGKQTVDDYLAELSREDLKSSLAAAEAAGVPVKTVTKVGSVAKAIADTAKTGSFDLVVLGSKGRTALADMLMGSVAQRVSELSPVSVLIVK